MARKKKQGKKSSPATVRLRIAEITRMRLAGAEFADIVEYAGKKDHLNGKKSWNVGHSCIRKYISQSNADIARDLEKDRGVVLNMHMMQSRYLYARAIDQGDVKAALSVMVNEAKLHNLYPEKPGPLEQLLAILPDDMREEFLHRLAGEVRPVAATIPPAPPATDQPEGVAGTAQ
jgi:hypothetical protein